MQRDLKKSADGDKKGSLREQTSKLGAELEEMSQQGVTPETKGMAKEAAQAAELAQKAMQLSQDLQEKGEPDQAGMVAENAAKELDRAAQQLESFARPGHETKGCGERRESGSSARAEHGKNATGASRTCRPTPGKPGTRWTGQQALEKAAQDAQGQAARHVPMPAQIRRPRQPWPVVRVLPACRRPNCHGMGPRLGRRALAGNWNRRVAARIPHALRRRIHGADPALLQRLAETSRK